MDNVIPFKPKRDDQLVEAYDRGFKDGREAVFSELSMLQELIRNLQAALDKPKV